MAVLAFQDFGDMLMELVSALESLDTSEIALVFAFSFFVQFGAVVHCG